VIQEFDHEIIIVDDNSPDGTGRLAQRMSETWPEVKVLIRKRKRGLSSAIADALRKAEGNFATVIDADLQHPPELLPLMIEEAKKGADLIIASRHAKGGGIEGWGLLRKLESKIAITLAHLALPATRRVRDPVSGYFMYRRDKIDEAELNPIGYKILLEILARGRFTQIVEVPYTFKKRQKGKSKLNWRIQIEFVKQVVQLIYSR